MQNEPIINEQVECPKDDGIIIEWHLKNDVQEDASQAASLCNVPCHGM